MNANYNYYETILEVLRGNIKNINFVYTTLNPDVANECAEETGEIFFAGTTEKELEATMNEVIAKCKPNEGETITVVAAKHAVTPEDVSDDIYDPDWNEEEEAEDAVNKLVQELFADGWFDVVDDRIIEYEYESLEGSILINWSWHTYVGYARDFKSLEYCCDKKNRQSLFASRQNI